MHVAPSTVPTSSEIEAIVRAVLQRLQAHPFAPLTGGPGPVTTAQATAPADSAVLRLDQPLVTLEDLPAHWGAVQEVAVPLRCVVTPAVYDELRRHGVPLLRCEPQTSSSTSQPSSQPPSKLLVLIPASGRSEVRSQLKLAEAQLAAVADCEESAMAALQSHLQDPQAMSIWSAPRPFAAMRACSRLDRAAAVQLSRLEELPEAIAQAQPNLLVLDDRRWTSSGVAQLAHAWLHRERHRHTQHRSHRR